MMTDVTSVVVNLPDEDPICHSGDELDCIDDEPSPAAVQVRKRLSHSISIRKALARSAAANPCSGHLHPSSAEESEERSKSPSSIVDWSDHACIGEHLWTDVSASTDFCYVGELDCFKQGVRKKCSVCRIIAHVACMEKLEKMNFRCRQTYREAGISSREYVSRHHWVHRRRQDGKCKSCSKSFQQKFAFHSSKDIIAIGCSWCKVAYHNKGACFKMEHIQETCDMGTFSSVIVPPSWIIRLPRKGSFKANSRRRRSVSARRVASGRRRRSRDELPRPFVIKSVPGSLIQPIVVFINPKSGGNQGTRLLQTFQWLLNPRQVFDLSTDNGPKLGLELYKRLPNLRVLACGGDGTVGWILSVFDSLGISPPVAILPLGTGNDLSRTLNWGGGYTDEPLAKVLKSVEEGPVVQLDRWDISVTPNSSVSSGGEGDDGESNTEGLDGREASSEAVSTLPLQVMNNYFSLGADAHVALEFHESREANPEKFNSRLRNKMFYAGAGGKDFVKRSWKYLSEHVQLICDGVDFTSRIQEQKLHCLLLLNIPRYSAGTLPWGSGSSNFEPQKHDDGYLEIIGFTYASLATLQVGGHGHRLCQCSNVVLRTSKPIPMQVDGEPCRLQPSTIRVSLRNQANMVFRAKRRGSIPIMTDSPSQRERLRLQVSRVTKSDYENFMFDKQRLRKASVPVGIVVINTDSDLEAVRRSIQSLRDDVVSADGAHILSADWCFLDSTTSDRLYRIDRSQEHINYITDISSEEVYIMDLAEPTTPQLQVTQHAHQGGCHLSSNEAVKDHLSSEHVSDNTSSCDSGVAIAAGSSDISLHSNACNSQKEKVLETALDHPIPLRPIDKRLLDTCKRGDLDRFRKLHEEGAQLEAVDQYGMSSLHHASRFGHKTIVGYITEHGTKDLLDLQDTEKQQTALHKAAWYQRRTICCMLLQAGASSTIRDHKGYTPHMQAVEAGDKELATYLEKCGAAVSSS